MSPRREQHAPAGATRLDGVVEQPRQQPGEHARVGVDRVPSGPRMEFHAGIARGIRLCGEHIGEQFLQVARRGMRLQRACIQLRQQQQAIEHVRQRAHPRMQLRHVAGLRGDRVATQLFQRDVHRLQRLPQVVADGGEEAILRADCAVGLGHQPDHVRGELPALRVVLVAGLALDPKPAGKRLEQRRQGP